MCVSMYEYVCDGMIKAQNEICIFSFLSKLRILIRKINTFMTIQIHNFVKQDR